ncbi:type IV pilus assembly protein PilM [Halanaerobium saccharolyticum]|uniref:Type IV pilus assembly protein PilM n=1 Tax=Halanaerobium saccharolyticum TaxID=43595 RepID=A0A4R7YYU1_9FIRM|nr:pilus assembly protein PilM [Halanaerobium saccharolyticum]RAK06715.1 type IV pilus assembly protein PilM [Halanaerobium saccharolyticum]TDW01352.1 type IV pilus assembly protein PilM [Halanaerobium saccharolyticum]TDX52820.1 type IV pilus assembly protein PilM [Halanaerobium saccharolyticum]
MAVSPLSLIRGIKYTSIDFGHNSIKYLNSRVKNDKFKLLASGRRELPAGTISDGKVVDTHLLTKIIADIFNEKNMDPGVLMLTPASGQEFVRNIKMPVMPREELKEALIWEVQDFLDLEAEKIALDYIILNEMEGQYELLVTGISKDILNGYLEIFENNMLKVKVFNLEDMALISLLTKKNKLESPSLILDIGASSSKILIAAKNKLFLSREVDTSGNNFSNLFLNEEINHEEAEIEKKKFKFFPGQAGEENLDLMLSDINTPNTLQKKVKDLADEIIFEVNRSLEYHNERHSENTVDDIYLTGGGLLLNGLVDYFKEEIDNKIFVIDPLKDFQIKENSNQINKHFLATAAGTIMSEVMHNES